MLAAHAKNLSKLRPLSSLLNQRNLVRSSDPQKWTPLGISRSSLSSSEILSVKIPNLIDGVRYFSDKSMRSKVEMRMQRESGQSLREIRRAKRLRRKLMTDEERLIFKLRRAKKKVALLLQNLKNYELPDLPPPHHDPELFTSEQLQAYKKIGFKNKNYAPVGVRGVFGGVVLNMHLHWKFHETVQVCCDNFPKEKVKGMAIMLARLSGGIVVNIHNGKTIIMFRGRNYRQPKVMSPINTLTKRKALFKARFEQALESQKLNIKKLEQDLRRKGLNPDDPVALASIQRVASTFFNAIDQREGSPYVFQEEIRSPEMEFEPQVVEGDESDQEELDQFIAEIEDAADKEWEAEEAAEKEEVGQIQYRDRPRFHKDDWFGGEGGDSDDEDRERIYENRKKSWNESRRREMIGSDNESDIDYSDIEEPDVLKEERQQNNRSRNPGFGRNESESMGGNDNESDIDYSDIEEPDVLKEERQQNNRSRNPGFGRNESESMGGSDNESDIDYSDIEEPDVLKEERQQNNRSRTPGFGRNESESMGRKMNGSDDYSDIDKPVDNRTRTPAGKNDFSMGRKVNEIMISEDTFGDLEGAMWDSDEGEGHNRKDSRTLSNHNYRSSDEE